MAAPNAPRKGRRSEGSVGTASASDLAVSHYNVDDLIIYCVRDESLPFEDQRYQEEVYDMLNLARVDPVWMAAEDCLNCEADFNFFIMPSFKGPAFERLLETKAKIVSTAVIRQCLNEGRPLPKWDHPVLSFNMEGVKICFSGLPIKRREELAKHVLWMCGVVTPHFYPGMTHLVTEKCVSDSDKYRISRNTKIPIMLPSWIEDAFEEAEKRNYSPCNTPEMTEKYRIPLFRNLIISTTGITGQERTDILRLVELHGGKCSGEMKKGGCTHLITETTVGEKYRKARQWGNIHIVTTRWLRKSVESGYLQEEKRFDPETGPAAKTSTQNLTTAPPPDLDVSSIYAPLKNQTLNSQWGGPLDGTLRKSSEKTVAPSPVMPRVQSRRRLSPGENLRNCALDKLLDTTLRGDFDFFEGWTVFVCGLARNQQEKINRILDRCGATRVTSSEQATHVVVANVGDQKNTLKDLQRSGNVEVVRADWLVDCVEKKEMLCTEGYIWDPESTLARSTSVVDDSHLNKSSKNRFSTASSASTSSKGVNLISEAEEFNVNPLASVTTSDLFLNHSFRLHLLESEQAILLEPLIESAGGKIIFEDQDDIADFMVSNPIELGSVPSPSEYRFTDLVTEFFVKYCLEKKKVFGPKNLPLFRPIPAVSGSTVFKGIVVGLMGFEELEKSIVKELVQRFGGIVEARIVSRERDGSKPCTHLVVAQNSSKLADCNKKFPRLKIVDASWIIECIINDLLLMETRFEFKERAFEGYERTDDMWVDPPPPVEADGNITVHMEYDRIDLGGDVPMDEAENIPDGEAAVHLTLGGNPDFAACAMGTPSVNPSVRTPVVDRSVPRNKRQSTDPMNFNPRFVLDGMTQFVDGIPSPGMNDSNISTDSFNVSGIRKMLSAAAIRTAQPQEMVLPQRSATEPTPSRSNRTATVETNGTPQQLAVKVEVKVPVVDTEKAPIVEKTTNLVKQQMERIREMNRREEEAEALKTQMTTTSKRKRVHEMVEDSPAPPVKRNSQEEPIIGWKCDQSVSDPSIIIEQEQVPSPSIHRSERRSATIELGSRSPKEVLLVPLDDTDDFISVAGPSILRRSTRLSNETSSAQVVSPVPRFIRERSNGKRGRRSDPALPQKVFLFTGISTDRQWLIEAVRKLGGKVNTSDKQEVPEEVTHLVCGKLVRGTKLMGCIASGRWIMTTDFLKESSLVGHWLPEDDFEWSAPAIVRSKNVRGRELQIANAAKRWRPAARGGKGAFWNWKVLLYATGEKVIGLAPLLEAGGAKVFVRDKATISEAKPTHAIVIKSPLWNTTELKELSALGVHVFTLDYVAQYLLEEKAREEDYFHTDYRLLRKQRGI